MNFKFFQKPFNTHDYDIIDFRFLGVTHMYINEDGRMTRKMIYVFERDGTIVPAQTINENHDAYHRADVYEVRDNQVFLIPRQIEVKFNIRTT